MSQSDDDSRKFELRFIPRRHPGVTAGNLDNNSTPLDCIYSILTDDILENLIVMINEFSVLKNKQNTPPRLEAYK